MTRVGEVLHVYVVGHRDRDDYLLAPSKIGISADPAKRFSSLQSGNPSKLGLCASIDLDSRVAKFIEKCVLARYEKDRLSGEWIAVAPHDLVQAVFDALIIAYEGLFGGESDESHEFFRLARRNLVLYPHRLPPEIRSQGERA